MEGWIIRGVALFCAAGSAGLLWIFGAFVVVPWRAGRMLALSSSEFQLLGASLTVGLAVGVAAIHLLALGERETHPKRFAVLRAAVIVLLIAAMLKGGMWTLQRG